MVGHLHPQGAIVPGRISSNVELRKVEYSKYSAPAPLKSGEKYPILFRVAMDDVPTVTILLLGDPDCGKSTFISYVCGYRLTILLTRYPQ